MLTIPAFGQQDLLAETSKFQTRFSELSKEFLASQRRILSSERAFAAQENALVILRGVNDGLTSNGREFGVLRQTLTLAMLVTDARAIPLAERIVMWQRDNMLAEMKHATEYIEETLPKAGDRETSRLLLQARDLLRSASEFTSSITAPLPKPKPN